MPTRIRGDQSPTPAANRYKQIAIVGLILICLLLYAESRNRRKKPQPNPVIGTNPFNDPGMGTGPMPAPTFDLKRATAHELAEALCNSTNMITSLQCVTSGDMILDGDDSIVSHRETAYNFRTAPPGLSRTVVDSRLGTVVTVVDGKNLFVYLGAGGQYTRRDVRGRLNEFCEEVLKDAPELFSPLTVFAGKEIPLGFGAMERKPDELEGADTLAVLNVTMSAEYSRTVARHLVPDVRYEKVDGAVTVWINVATGAIRRWYSSLTMMKPPTAAKAPSRLRMRVRENVGRFTPNIVLPDKNFAFTPPKGSVEITANPVSR